jgi:hypothetical protein
MCVCVLCVVCYVCVTGDGVERSGVRGRTHEQDSGRRTRRAGARPG